eukprot:CAMPEP_0197310992 /NCGR_PEP_ID=MMETSP0891-20130614/9519_1 /TAXON_ID=44058 ORGANISM="Aureoumbra lagunensis, Strain CCMP1510" /NCGR_SAMPLE_ID=MMETSP0891 /ASSEMBLY_ACC=CAM_ASM_000534 /LENGTH=455 /DNA_ID=CAMNT_0042796895 /DNA_START=113 /DNA_END=1480 /DNA_ORIENTATION=+
MQDTQNIIDDLRSALVKRPLRRGKWTQQEQLYSEACIQWFLQGIVPLCENGSTLRAFLSTKLHCAPMRFTKKFAGAALGKSIFTRRGHLLQDKKEAFEQLEIAFLHEVLNNSDDVLPLVTSRHRKNATSSSRHRQHTSYEFNTTSSIMENQKPSGCPPRSRSKSSHKRTITRMSSGTRHDSSHQAITYTRDNTSLARASSVPSLRNSPSTAWANRVANKAALVMAKRREADLTGDTNDISNIDDNSHDIFSLPVKNTSDTNAYNSDSSSSIHVVSDFNASPDRNKRHQSLSINNNTNNDLDNELYGWLPSDIGLEFHTSSLEDHLGLALPVVNPHKTRPFAKTSMHASIDTAIVTNDTNSLQDQSPSLLHAKNYVSSNTLHSQTDTLDTNDTHYYFEPEPEPEPEPVKRRRTSPILQSKPISLATTAEGLSTLECNYHIEDNSDTIAFDWISPVS